MPGNPDTPLDRQVAFDTPSGRRTAGSQPQPPTSSRDASVLVAGRDAGRRSAVIEELAQTMSHRTRFEHAAAVWEVLVRAGSSSMVILSDDLDGMPTKSLMRMLSHRYPALPVVGIDPATLTSAPVAVG